MRLLSIDGRPEPRSAVAIESEVLDFAVAADILPTARWIPPSMPNLLAAGEDGLDWIRRIVEQVRENRADLGERLRNAGGLRPFQDVKLAPAVPRPGIVLSHGRAYLSHLREMNEEPVPKEPKAFMKNVNSVIAPNAPILLPPQCPDMVDFEGEFTVVFGRPCHNVTEAEAMTTVAGYTIINDVSARDWVETKDWDLNRMGKQLPSFTPLGPVIVTKDEIPDPHDVQLTTTLNGEIMQSAHTSDLIWKVPALIAFFSRWYPFRPGDLLTTGSPAGVGYGRTPKVFMKAGDTIAVTIDRIGTLANPIASGALISVAGQQ